MKKRILLVFPSLVSYTFDEQWVHNPMPVPPLGLLYLATPLRKNGYEVKFMDMNAVRCSRKEFVETVKNTDILGISVMSRNYDIAQEMIKDVKTINQKILIICGGPHCVLVEELVPGSDVTVVGEGEEIIVDLVNRVLNKQDLAGIDGIIYKTNGRIVKTKLPILIDNLDRIDLPATDLADYRNYGYLDDYKFSNKVRPICTSRGCPYSCKFCVLKCVPKYRERSVENVLQEIEKIYQDKNCEYLAFNEDNFLVNKKRAEAIFDGIISRGIKLKLVFQARVDSANEQLYKKFRKAGAKIVMFGLESGCQDILDYYHKRTTVEQNEYAVKLADKHDIFVYSTFIFGASIETQEHLDKTLKFILRLPIDMISVNVLKYDLGSPLWEELVEKNLIKKTDISVITDKRFSNFSTEEWEKFREKLNKKFYFRISYIARVLKKCVKQREILILRFLFNYAYKVLTNFYSISLWRQSAKGDRNIELGNKRIDLGKEIV